MSLKLAIFAALAATTIWFVWTWWRLSRKSLPNVPDEKKHTWYHAPVAFVMCFFDTLGLGNFATTTAAFKFRNSVPDVKIPGTLNVGYALQTVAQAFIYIAIIQVDIWTLVLMIVASVAGAWLGAGVVCHWPRKKIRIGMGFALLGAATLLFLTLQGIAPGGGTDLSLQGVRLGLGLAGNFALGALMTLGIGLYAPCLILVSLLGMSPAAAFPIMMGSCAFLMPVGGIRFIKEGSYAP
ncbi:MAG: TSUP family transporter, partial [Candidatus Acidiferrales bacterium]